MDRENFLTVAGLSIRFGLPGTARPVVDDVSFDVVKGQTLGIVGESGCGKSVTAFSIMRLLPQPMGRITDGQILFDGRDLASLDLEEMQDFRGREAGK